MYVKPPLVINNHLLTWVCSETKHIGYTQPVYTLEAFIQTDTFFEILKNIDEEYFGVLDTREDRIEQICKLIQTYLIKECGKRMKKSLKEKLINHRLSEQLIKLLLYVCLHSKKKQIFVARILQLEEKIQSTLMEAVEQINSYLLNIVNHNDVLIRVEQLENQAQTLKNQLTISNSRVQLSKKCIQELEQELATNTKELNAYKAEKQKVIEALQLSNFDEYLTSFQRLQKENEILNKYVQQLQETNNRYEQNQKALKRDIANQSIVIVDLNDHITFLKQKIRNLNMQNSSSLKFSFEDSLDVSRSFGTELYLNQKQNYGKKGRGKCAKSLQTWQQSAIQRPRPTAREEALLSQMQQLQKYNSDLIHKLDTVYKTLNTLTMETSYIKEQNEKLEKQNKFYKKQIGSLKKLHEKMAEDIMTGKI